MKVWVLAPGENWIVDEMAKQFKQDNPEICTNNVDEADVVWSMADWCFDRIPVSYIKSGKPILTMLHHFVPDKFTSNSKMEFRAKDTFTTMYTAPNYRTQEFVMSNGLTSRPIHIVPYWAHTESWKITGAKEDFRDKYEIPATSYVIGSFQRDTEGHDLVSPKLEKGPDIFCDFIEKLASQRSDICVILAGWRRQYVINRLNAAGVVYKYFELPSQEVVNELYQTLDLYPITSRHEGGPQALIEAGMLGTRVVSRPVGIAELVLTDSAIADDVFTAVPEVPNVERLRTPKGYALFIDLLKGLSK